MNVIAIFLLKDYNCIEIITEFKIFQFHKKSSKTFNSVTFNFGSPEYINYKDLANISGSKRTKYTVPYIKAHYTRVILNDKMIHKIFQFLTVVGFK